jgi:hypothetical protein
MKTTSKFQDFICIAGPPFVVISIILSLIILIIYIGVEVNHQDRKVYFCEKTCQNNSFKGVKDCGEKTVECIESTKIIPIDKGVK